MIMEETLVYFQQFISTSLCYQTLTHGLDYKPNDNTMMVGPLTGKVTIVNDDSLANAGAFC